MTDINSKVDTIMQSDDRIQQRIKALEQENEMLKAELRRLQPQTVTISADEYRRLRYKAGFYDRVHNQYGQLNLQISETERKYVNEQ